MKIAVIAVGSKEGEQGGAERFYQGLVSALNESGVVADLLTLVSDETNFDTIQESLLRFYDLDLSAYEGVISTKSPSYLVRHPNHICYLVHTMRVFYDMFDAEFAHPPKELLAQRQLIHQIDTGALRLPRTKKLFTIGHEVSNRLLKWNHLESEVIHPALLFDDFRSGPYEYLFMPGRLHRWKRVDLVIQAFKYVKASIKLKIAGTGEDEEALKALAGGDGRIEFLGRISDEELIEHYAHALAVPFMPKSEDYGYVTLEAFKSEKAVITCADSGEPTYFVKDGENGFVCPPDPRKIAKQIEFLAANRTIAETMGRKGKASIEHISWGNIANTLIDALRK